jgi:osmoprotectant transport system permease protein
VLEFLWSHRSEVATLTLEHFWLVAVSIALATTLGLPLGVLVHRKTVLKQPILGATNLIQTIPSLALFGLLLPVTWLGERADRLATVALTLYALLPIIRNTYEGLTGVERSVTEAARGMGMTDRQVLWQVELPLATPFILAGIRVATVISIGTATIAAAIGAGGLGELIFRGLAMVDNRVILAGAVPAALLALLADAAFGVIEHKMRVPRANP